LRLPAILITTLLFGLIVFAVVGTRWQIAPEAPLSPTTTAIAEQLFGPSGFILPLEIAAVLILAVILGAIVIAREK
jgi:NADH:ubiquinone oxidoreductase subunit 6 (subunit J)